MGNGDVTSKPLTYRDPSKVPANQRQVNNTDGTTETTPPATTETKKKGTHSPKNQPRRAVGDEAPVDVAADQGRVLAETALTQLAAKNNSVIQFPEAVGLIRMLDPQPKNGKQAPNTAGIAESFIATGARNGALVGLLKQAAPEARDGILTGLTKNADQLSVKAKANLLVALQMAGPGAGQAGFNKAVVDVFKSTHGQDLADLKAVVDRTGDFTGLKELVFGSVSDDPLKGGKQGARAAILAHFETEVSKMPEQPRKVLSDVDDTFYCNLFDKSVPKKTEYPGVKAFYAALEAGPKNLKARSTDLGFLTARPALVGDLTQHTLKKHGIEGEVLLENDILHGIGNDIIAKGKSANYQQEKQLYPERKIIFLGDSGQGDPSTGEAMLKDPAFQKAKGSVYIHDIALASGPKTSAADRKKQEPMIFSNTYAGHAAAAFQKKDISADQLISVAQAVRKETAAINNWESDAQRDQYLRFVNEDIDAVNAALKAAGDPRRVQ